MINLTFFQMYKLNNSLLIALMVAVIGCNQSETPKSEVQILPPEELYGELFYDVQLRDDLFPDSKTFVDCIPNKDVGEILTAYGQLEDKESAESMLSFLQEHFEIPGYEEEVAEEWTKSAGEHIKGLWGKLGRPADEVRTGTLLPLKNPYVVPGGRFREVYYWDSYFTMLGLQVDGEVSLIDNVLENFSGLIDSVGFVPNGNRTYYLSRSQPPFYSLMVDLHVSENKTRELGYYLPILMKEYDFWMEGAGSLSNEKSEHRRVVRLSEGEVLNRYWDDRNDPRAESYREDVETVREALEKYPNKIEGEAYRHLRAAAESGWDFSTRWFEIEEEGTFDLSSIHTTDIIPVDLNALLYHLEKLIATALEGTHMHEDQSKWEDRADRRMRLIQKYCWSEKEGFYMDYDFKKAEHTPVKSLAGLYPLFFRIADADQAKKVAEGVNDLFLQPGGVVTTLNDSGQQWDYPNGWAPLQWMTIKGLRNYEEDALADTVAERWLSLNRKVFANTNKMTEKYNVVDLTLEGGGGEYPNQDGFGWTNGVFQKLASTRDED